ncbi:uncharacterized protein UBRO_02865 [Ustilago bromivora]|uniref:Uncharacterized protein n=1 Tax=Ustilago bromivora TaxID=307758 RepID=A0A1K0H576_9BASI|nr:uncharacterized protein UBRO_02865 [Ustilago bromivora]
MLACSTKTSHNSLDSDPRPNTPRLSFLRLDGGLFLQVKAPPENCLPCGRSSERVFCTPNAKGRAAKVKRSMAHVPEPAFERVLQVDRSFHSHSHGGGLLPARPTLLAFERARPSGRAHVRDATLSAAEREDPRSQGHDLSGAVLGSRSDPREREDKSCEREAGYALKV